MTCSKCGAEMKVSDKVLDGVNISVCRPCGKFRIVGDSEWIDAGHGFFDRLKARAVHIGRIKATEQALAAQEEEHHRRIKEIMEIDSNDPRWTTFEV